jgi:hypothetical protein
MYAQKKKLVAEKMKSAKSRLADRYRINTLNVMYVQEGNIPASRVPRLAFTTG